MRTFQSNLTYWSKKAQRLPSTNEQKHSERAIWPRQSLRASKSALVLEGKSSSILSFLAFCEKNPQEKGPYTLISFQFPPVIDQSVGWPYFKAKVQSLAGLQKGTQR